MKTIRVIVLVLLWGLIAGNAAVLIFAVTCPTATKVAGILIFSLFTGIPTTALILKSFRK